MSCLAALAAHAEEYFVSPKGADTNPGTLERPFATLQRAQQAARQKSGDTIPIRSSAGVTETDRIGNRVPRFPVTVFLREGTHYLPETLVLTAEDSGTKVAPVVYQAYQKEQAVISGGMKLENLKWEPYQNGIMLALVPAGTAFDQLFVNGERQHMARYPNFNPTVRHFNGYAADAISPQRAARWKDPAGGFIHAMHSAEWGGMHYVITGKGPDNKIAYQGGWQNNRPSGMHGQFRMVENIFEELDAPGEWFLDGKTATLYFYPPEGVNLATAAIEVVRLRHLFEFRGAEQAPVRFVTLKGLTFRHAARTFMDNKEPLVRSDWTTYRGGALFYTGTEDCVLEDCFIDQVGGNAVFVNNYNRRLTVRGCHIAKAGGNGVAFIGDRDAARVPRDWKDNSQKFATLDRTPGPKTNNYPAGCLVEDCLIYLSGRVEKQTAPVQIELSQSITVRHCSLYDVPRAGINIGDGCWGGHVIEFCDIFDTVKETGDHGSFNSWGRDRFWGLNGLDLNNDKVWEAEKDVPLLDAVKTVILRNNRWRCDHGWDIDLDDGSTNYELRNNLCLNGGIKNREGFYRVVENNIMVNNGFHPHVWYKHSQDAVRRNIMWTDHYLPAGGMPSTPWGKEMDYNLVHRAGVTEPKPATKLAEQSKRDANSIVADALFMDAANGDFRVKDGSPALSLGFVNFPMDQFGVQKPELKAIARAPQMPAARGDMFAVERVPGRAARCVWQAKVRDISGLGDRSAYGLPEESGVLMLHVPAESPAARAGLQKDDVVLACNGKPVRTVSNLLEIQEEAAGKKLTVSVVRKQQALSLDVADYAFVVTEYQATPDFKTIPLAPAPATAVLPAKILAGAPGTMNEPVAVLTDGKLGKNYGPVFGNGCADGMYKLDLGAAKSVAQVNTFSYNQNGNRGRQRFVLYGSNAAADPGWNVEDPRVFTPLADVDTRKPPTADFVATSIRQSDGKPLGSYRWLIWAIAPVTTNAGGENTSFQEFQVLE
ncbi:MAG: PDZ domain-containing protein [Planctomycetota bacterium]|nr:PDZ domain-containing protein [Planctomycetota bacterium]